MQLIIQFRGVKKGFYYEISVIQLMKENVSNWLKGHLRINLVP